MYGFLDEGHGCIGTAEDAATPVEEEQSEGREKT